MLGVNISQSQEEEETKPKRTGFFDTGTIISIVLVGLSVAVWGGIQLYMQSLDKKIATIDASVVQDSGRLSGENIDRIADFDARVAFFASKQPELVEPLDMLKKLEETMVSGIVLTDYEYDHEMNVGIVSGKASDFRALAEQILSFKTNGLFSQVGVKRTERDEDGVLHFTLNTSL
jgi:hypothetical protein